MPDTLATNGANENGSKIAPKSPTNSSAESKMKFNGSSGVDGLLNGAEALKNGTNRFVFEDQDHFNFLLDKMNTLRKSKQFCDVALQVGSQQDVHEIYAHRAVLASASPYFLDMFATDSNFTSGSHLQLYKLLSGNYDVEAFELLVDFIYTARLDIKAELVKPVYTLANRLKITSCAIACGQYLASNLTPDSCLSVRSIPGVLADPLLLNAVDNYIKSAFNEVASCKSLETLPKVKIELLCSNREERAASSEKQLLSLVLDFTRKLFDFNGSAMTIDMMTEKIYMLYYNKADRKLHDCEDIQAGDSKHTDVVRDYKRISRKLSFGSSNKSLSVAPNGESANSTDEAPATNNGNGNGIPAANGTSSQNATVCSKPARHLFTRSDSDSSLSSLADDDESDWKVLGTHQPIDSKHTIIGLVMMAGKIVVLTVKKRLNTDPNRVESAEDGERIDDQVLTNKDAPPQCASMSTARCAAGTVSIDGKLFVCGGYDRGECLKSAEIYDQSTNSWTTLSPMKHARGRFDICVINDKVYAVGGSDGQNELSSCEAYEPNTNGGAWRQLPNCPVARSNAGVCALDGKVYVIGGWNGERGLKRCDVFDPETETWTQVASLTTGRYQAGCVAFGASIWAVGGCDSWSCLNSVERYDQDTGNWKAMPPMNTSRRGCGVAVFNGKVYVVAGHDGSRSLNSVEIYENGQWTLGPLLNQARANVGVAVIGSRLYCCGGFNGKQFLSTIEYLDPNTDEWCLYESSGEQINHAASEPSLSEKEGTQIEHSLSKCSLLSDEPLVEVEEAAPELPDESAEVD